MEDMLTMEYDGCGRCLVGVRRLSRKSDKTNSPEKQGNQILGATSDAGGIAVGTALAGGPPRRSQRAGLPHWAPAMSIWRRTAVRETGA